MVKSFIEKINESKIDYKIYDLDKLDLDTNIHNCVKALVLEIKNKTYIIALKLVNKLDYRKLADIVDVNRQDIKIADESVIRNILECEPGDIPPYCNKCGLQIIYDKKILDIDIMYCSAGIKNRVIQIETNKLINCIQPHIHDIVKEV